MGVGTIPRRIIRMALGVIVIGSGLAAAGAVAQVGTPVNAQVGDRLNGLMPPSRELTPQEQKHLDEQIARSEAPVLAPKSTAMALGAPVIDVWYGLNQTFGQVGTPQNWVNILGTVTADDGLASLEYTLNGGPQVTLSVGPDDRRLAEPGDFNVDLAIGDLLEGANEVVITATDALSVQTTATVTVNYTEQNTWPLPYSVDWDTVTDIQDATQIVDGRWQILAGGIRTTQVDYDRVLDFGDLAWDDYELTTTVTLHGTETPGPLSGSSGGMGFIHRWLGHSDSPAEAGGLQPKSGWLPSGAASYYSVASSRVNVDDLNDPSVNINIGDTVNWKFRVESPTGLGGRYSVKIWPLGDAEPAAWNVVKQRSPGDETNGSLVFYAHHTDVTLGDVLITEVPLTLGTVQVLNTGPTTALVSWHTNDPATSKVEFGLDNTYGTTVSDPTLVTEHSVTLTGLTPNTTHHFRVSSTDADLFEAVGADRVFDTTPSTVVSDDFNSCDLNTGLWTPVDPLGDATISVDGTRSQIALPAATGQGHSAWGTGPGDFENTLPRIMQPASDTDFQLEVKFESGLTTDFQSQGILIEQDANDLLMLDFFRNYNNDTRIRVLKIVDGDGSNFNDWGVPIAAVGTEPLYLRVNRNADTWTITYSVDGVAWAVYNVVEHPMNVTSVGVFAGNGGTPVAGLTANVDYFFNSTTPVVPEDPIVRVAPVLAPIGDRAMEPDATLVIDLTATDGDLDPIALTASGLPAFASLVDNGDGTGTITLTPGAGDVGDYDITVTATDAPCGLLDTETITVHVGTIVLSSLVSDDFNSCSLDPGTWTFKDLAGDASAAVNGYQATISVPAGAAHDVWGNGPGDFSDTMPRLMQVANDTDFEIETRFESALATQGQVQGIIIEQDVDDLLRIELSLDGSSQTQIAIYKITDGDGTNIGGWGTPITAGGTEPLRLKVQRAGDLWTVSYSIDDGGNWVVYQTFTEVMTITAAGVHCGNGGAPVPAHTAIVDFFFNLASPISPEDPVTRNAPVLALIGDQSLNDDASLTVPVTATDADLETPALTASGLPAFVVLNDFGDGTGELVITPQAGDAGDYPITVTASDACGLFDTEDLTIQVINTGPALIVSDDFNDCALDTGLWTFVDLSGNAAAGVNGTQAVISLPAGTVHELWGTGPGDFIDTMPRLMQATTDGNFEVEARFESGLTTHWQSQGIIVAQDADDMLRLEFAVNVADETTINAYRIVAGAGEVLGGAGPVIATTGTSPLRLKVGRVGDLWTVSYSIDDGSNWVVYQTFTHAMVVSSVGVHSGNGGTNLPAHAAVIDYFFNTATPISPEDPVAYNAPVLAPIGDQMVAENASLTVPVSATDADPETPVLSASGLPAFATFTDFADGTGELVLNPGPTDTGNYPVTITATDGCGLFAAEAITIQVGTPVPSILVSDDFNDCTLDTGLWTFVDQAGDATAMVNGTQAVISVPAGTVHDLWGTGPGDFADTMPRLMQSANDVDFEVETRFESALATHWQGQGIIVEQDANDLLRLEFAVNNSGETTIAVYEIADGAGSNVGGWGTPIAAAGATPLRMKVGRVGDLWTVSYSIDDGNNWVIYQTFTHAMAVTAVGVHCGNGGTNLPAHAAVIDFFFNTTAPVVPEDPVVFNAPVLAPIGDQIVAEDTSLTVPVTASDADLETPALTASGLPAFATFNDFGDGTGELVLNPGATDTGDYPVTITATDPCGLFDSETITVTVGTIVVSSLVSDDFNCHNLDTGLWNFVNPLSDATIALNGTQAVVTVPGGGAGHDLWGSGPGDFADSMVRLMQPANDADFELEARFESGVNQGYQMQGVLVAQDENDLLRAEFFASGTGLTKLAVFKIVDGAGSNVGGWGTEIAPLDATPLGLRIQRQGDLWTVSYSTDDVVWNVYQTFTYAMTVTEAGLHFGNGGAPVPTLISSVDYFFNQASPIVPEDGNVLNSPVLTAIPDQNMFESQTLNLPLNATDPDSDPLTLSAVGLPAFGSLTDNGDGTGALDFLPQPGDAGVYPIQVFASDPCATPAMVGFTLTVDVGSASTIVSDDFNSCTLNGALWSWTDPVADSMQMLSGAQLLITVPDAAAHSVTGTGSGDYANNTARLMQPVNDSDLGLEVRFESGITAVGQGQGVFIQQDSDDLLAVDFVGIGTGRTSLRARTFVAGAGAQVGLLDLGTTDLAPLALRLDRVGDDWTITYSTDDGASWPAFTVLNHGLSVTEVGVFAANEGAPAPQHHVVVDYFFNRSLPIVPEDALPCAVPAAITDLTVSQLVGGNDADGTTKVGLIWSPLACAATVDVYRKGYGDYPSYGSGAVPTAPVDPAQAQSEGWTLAASVPATLNSYEDETVDRDYWYYVAMVRSGCGDVSPVSNLSAGVLNYLLGDVSDAVTPGQGNNLVAGEDISLLGSVYGLPSTHPSYLDYIDVGPTVGGGVLSRPVPDGSIEFEDLILFAVNYDAGLGAQPGTGYDPNQAVPNVNEIGLIVPGIPAVGQTFPVNLFMRADGKLRGVSVPLLWDDQVVQLVSVQSGPFLSAQPGAGVMLTPAPGTVDAAVLGGENIGLEGDGVLATVTFEVIGAGDPNLGLAPMRGRDSDNQDVLVTEMLVSAVEDRLPLPQLTTLHQNAPNPFNPMTKVSFDLAEAGPVRVRIYSVNGALVKTLLDEELPAGQHDRMWNGKDDNGQQVASGAYFMRLETRSTQQTRRMMLIK